MTCSCVIRELLLGVVILAFARPLVGPIAYAAVLAVSLHPVYELYPRRHFGMLLVLVSTALLVCLLYGLTVTLFDQVQYLTELYSQLSPETRVQLVEFGSNLPLQEFALRFATALPSMVVGFSFFLIFAYYFLVDGHRVKDFFREYLPDGRAETLIREGWANLRSVVLGVFVVMFVYTVISTSLLYLTNSPYPLLFSIISALFGPLPVVGAWFVYVYVVYVHLVAGRLAYAALLTGFQVLWYFFLEPFFRTRYSGTLHPAVLLGSMAAGIAYFGFSGFVVGPLIATGLKTIARVRREHVGPVELSEAE